MTKAEGKRRSLFRSNSELHELSQGLAAHGGNEGTCDKPGRKSFAKFARQLTGSGLIAAGSGDGGSGSSGTGPASEALPGPNDRRLSMKAKKAVVTGAPSEGLDPGGVAIEVAAHARAEERPDSEGGSFLSFDGSSFNESKPLIKDGGSVLSKVVDQGGASHGDLPAEATRDMSLDLEA